MGTEIEQTFDALTVAVKKLQQENDRLKADGLATWKAESAAREAKEQVRQLTQQLEKASRELNQCRCDADYWKRATYYEQQLKKMTTRPRHVPTYNFTQRRKHDGGPLFTSWINRERHFLAEWRWENRTHRRGSALASILSENSNAYAADISQRDATVAATVVQWLGTNCGQSFLHEVNRRIEQAKTKKATQAKRAV